MRKRGNITKPVDEENLFLISDEKRKHSLHTVPALVAIELIAVLLGLFLLVYITDNNLPTPLYLSDEETHPDAFITERARRDLKSLTDLGPRIAGGYENEVLTVDLLKREINTIIQAANPNQKIELDVQEVTGSYYLKKVSSGKIVAYSNLQNVIVKLYANNNVSQTVLINAHFDSVPTSPGGSDDGINCAVMLEVLRKLSKESERPLNNVIFLFNGAEETGLQASHGFITKHKWAKDCKVVLNLEAAGAGGKIILFQSGPSAPWLMDYYKNVPHPYGHAAAEEIFQSNLIPSDTDFRIFRDYGDLVGLDTAFVKNGYRYHTKYDDFDHIPLGSFQHVGDNTLSLVRQLSNAPEVENPKENPGQVIYFDFLGLFFVTYSLPVAQAVNYVVVLLSIGLFLFSIYSFNLGLTEDTIKYLAMTIGAVIGGWIIAVIAVVAAAIIIDKIGYSMSWYANPWLLFGLYGAPTFALLPTLFPLASHTNITYSIKSQIQIHCVRVVFSVILLIGTILNIRAMYVLLVPVLFNTIAFSLIHLLNMQHTIRRWQVIHVISLVIPTMFLMYIALLSLSLFVPITGRNGSDTNAELMIGVMTASFTILITAFFVALASLVRNIRFLMICLGTVFVVSVIIIFTPLGFPYTGNSESPAPERYWTLHTSRVFHDEKGTEIKKDYGYFLLNMDRNSPDQVKDYVPDLARATSLTEDCNTYLLCGLPLVHLKMIKSFQYSTWVPADELIVNTPAKLEVLSKVYVSPTNIRYNISIEGPDRVGVYLSPKSEVKVTDISLIDEMPPAEETGQWNGRDIYYIAHNYGMSSAPLAFTFDVEVNSSLTDVNVEIAISGIYVHDKINPIVPDYARFINDFPDWADVTAWLGTYESWWI